MAPADAFTSALIVGIVSLLIGGFAIWMGVRFVIDESASFGYAIITAAIGAVVWAILSFIGGIPLVGPLLMLVIWIAIINWRYPGGWITATAVGLVAWLIAVVVLYALATFDVVAFEALGIPGA